MKSKVVISFLLVSLIFLVVFQVEGFAEDKTWNSKATITFEVNDRETPPLDPEDPTKPLDPADPDDTTHQTGPLSLDYVSSIDFGNQKVESAKQTYQSTSLKPFIQITDNRGTGTGWKVTAAASSFNDGTKDTLLGSIITFKNGKVVSPTTGLAAPTPNLEVVLSTNGVADNVVTAPVDTGLGTWLNRWFPTTGVETNDNVTLEIPAGVATVGTHTATITWTLTDAPS